ncbi:MAG TPA: PrgI family protein [Gaiellaceae bacterium]|nr:PrgI family protein [Gaiellaceae bacterium]
MSERVRLPADIELEDRLAFGLSFRQLTILGLVALVAYGVFTGVSALLPLPAAAAAAAPVALAGALLALVRRDGLPADRLALLATRHLSRPQRRVLAPEGLPARLPGAPPRPRVAPLELPVRGVLRSGLVELQDGSFCQLLRASSTSFALRSEAEQAALVEAFGRFLNSSAEPLQIVVASEPVDLEERAALLEREALALPSPALRRAALAHARFLSQLASGQDVRRREILLVLSVRARDRPAAQTALERRAAEAVELLRAAGVELRALGGEETAGRLARALDSPGPPLGSTLTGVVRT